MRSCHSIQELAQDLAQLAGGSGEQDFHAGVSSIGVSPESSSR
jgi:hypothetical protein